MNMCARVLDHHLAVAVVQVGEYPGLFGHIVEEELLAAQILLEGFVIVQVVVRDVGEDTALEADARNAILCQRVGADLHETVLWS